MMYDTIIEEVPDPDLARLAAFGHPGPPPDTFVDGVGDEWAREPGEAWVKTDHSHWRRLAPGEPAPTGEMVYTHPETWPKSSSSHTDDTPRTKPVGKGVR